MSAHDDFLVEIRTEELPAPAVLTLAIAWKEQIKVRLEKAALSFAAIAAFATPRRLAVWVQALSAVQPTQLIERKGPALRVAFDAQGVPSAACLAFARACGVAPTALITIEQSSGKWIGVRQEVPGQAAVHLLPALVEQALQALPMRRMRWGQGNVSFIRPVHSVVMLYGETVMDTVLLGCRAGRITRGHRFHAPGELTIPHAAQYATVLETKGYVIPDFAKRRERIVQQMTQWVSAASDALLDEVTGLVEWPIALRGQFDAAFLNLQTEVLMASMQTHQRYFPLVDTNGQLQPAFVVISNIDSHDASRVIQGNERVLRARLADAAFFYETDQKERLEQRVERLKQIMFQAKLGTLYEKTERLKQIAVHLAHEIGMKTDEAARAAWLAKADLTTQMVGEFPTLQGVMGRYYARHDGETEAVAQALQEQYLPRFAGDSLPDSRVGQVLAIADRLDLLVGTFGIHEVPTGEKDPYGLRRAALGVLRLLIEKAWDVDLMPLLEYVAGCYTVTLAQATVPHLLAFMQERLRVWYQDQAVTPDVFAAVAALRLTHPFDIHQRIQAVSAFRALAAAQALSLAHKRVHNILKKSHPFTATEVNPALFDHPAEEILWQQLAEKQQKVKQLCSARHYEAALLQLAELKTPIDAFFTDVMVMVEDRSRRENRLLILNRLRHLFLLVADIALLQ
jgi:glycyl-tRNA synthetase beta chain